MRRPFVAVLLVIAAVPALAQSGFTDRPITSNAFEPTGYTLHKGEFTVGIGPLAFGVAENVQIGTNILLWAFQVYNADLKVALMKSDEKAVAVGVSYSSLDLDLGAADGDAYDVDVNFMSIGPYGAASLRMGENTMVHLGGRVAIFDSDDPDADIEDADAEAAATGTTVFGGIEQSYSARTKFVADVSYDTTFEGARFGGAVLFGWTTFRLKLGVSYFTAGDGFVFPLIGLWWRFRA